MKKLILFLLFLPLVAAAQVKVHVQRGLAGYPQWIVREVPATAPAPSAPWEEMTVAAFEAYAAPIRAAYANPAEDAAPAFDAATQRIESYIEQESPGSVAYRKRWRIIALTAAEQTAKADATEWASIRALILSQSTQMIQDIDTWETTIGPSATAAQVRAELRANNQRQKQMLRAIRALTKREE